MRGLSVATVLQSLEAFESPELADLEEVIRRAGRVHTWLGKTGGGFNLKGKTVVKHRDSQRPSCTEPEIYDALSPFQKAEHLKLVAEQKRVKLAIFKERAITLRGHSSGSRQVDGGAIAEPVASAIASAGASAGGKGDSTLKEKL